MTNAIELSNLTKSYGAFRLDGVSFTVPTGSIMGLIGENGAGKSTTIKCMLGLVFPDSGSIRLLDRDPFREESLREELGVVLDESAFHDALGAADVGRILSRSYRSWDQPLFQRYLEQFELPRGKTLKEYSRGMKMKLGIAAALAHHPRLLLLDEATGGLDPVVRNQILDEFLSFIQDEEHSILISSHITGDLEKIADYVSYLHKGRLTLSGPKDQLLEHYGRLVCTRDELAKVDSGYLKSVRSGQFSCEALIHSRREFCARYPGLTVDRVTLEDLMIFTSGGDQG